MSNDNDSSGGWNSFDFEEWGVDGASEATPNGHVRDEEEAAAGSPRAPEGQWISQGGVLRWETPDDEDESKRDLRTEAASVWARDDVDLPPGVPDDARIRAARAWLARQRQLESQEVGALLLERRASGEDEDAAPEGEGP